MRKSLGGGSQSHRSSGSRHGRRPERRSPAVIQRDISQLRAWAEGRTKLELIVHGEVCSSRYVGNLTETIFPHLPDAPAFKLPAAYDFEGQGVKVRLIPELWSRSELSTDLEVYGKRGSLSLTIGELTRHGPDTENFRAVLNQLTAWSGQKAQLAVYFFLGPCTPAFVAEVRVDAPGVVSFLRRRSFLQVDIRKYDMMGLKVQDQHTTVLLVDSARGASLQISDAPMSHAQVLEQFQSGTA